MLNSLDHHKHYTYSVWPSSYAVKSKVDLKFYQRPIYNYRLECAADPERSMETLE